MSRVALLVGVSRYAAGLDPLPDAQKDVEVMRRVLKQPRFQFEVHCLSDCPLQAMQEGIERFFEERASDDQILFLFCGYTLQEADGRLYFATPSTALEDRGAIVKAQTIPASVLQDAMNSSPAKQQVLILDTYNRAVSHLPVSDRAVPEQTVLEQPVLEKKVPEQTVIDKTGWDRTGTDQTAFEPSSGAEPSSDLAAQLGGVSRVILSASNGDRPYPTPTAIDAWTYTRYLADGIESGAADTDDDGSVTAADLHHYATQKLQVAAPGLTPQRYDSPEDGNPGDRRNSEDGNAEHGSLETAQMPLFEVPHHEPQVRYRKVLETAAIVGAVEAAESLLAERRSLLNDVRHSLGVSPQDAAALEAQVLRPTQDYRQRLECYQEQVADYARSHDVASAPIRQALKQLQQALCLTDHDVAIRTIAPLLAGQQQTQQQELTQYQRVLLWAMQRQYPLREGDRSMLQRLQQTLGLEDDDVRTAETQITTQAEQFWGSEFGSLPATASVEPPTAPAQPETRSAEPTVVSPDLSPSEATGTGSREDSRAKEVVLQRLFNMTEPTRLPHSEPLSSSETTGSETTGSETTFVSALPVTPVPEESPPVLSTALPNMDRIRRSASNYQALIVPAILLAAIVGLVAAVLSSGNRPDWFKPGWFNFGQTTPDPLAAQRLKTDGLRKAREGFNKEAIDDYNQAIQKNPNDATTYINRGIARHKLGDPGAAIQDYEQALKLAPSAVPHTALLHNNLSYAYYDRQNYDKALEEGNTAVAQNPRLAQAYINLANARAKKGDMNGALLDYQRAIALRPAAEVQAGAYNNRGNVQLALNKISEAISDYRRAIRLKSDYADAYYNLGLARQAQGNRTAAIRSLQRAASYYQQQQQDALQKEANDRAIALQRGNS